MKLVPIEQVKYTSADSGLSITAMPTRIDDEGHEVPNIIDDLVPEDIEQLIAVGAIRPATADDEHRTIEPDKPLPKRYVVHRPITYRERVGDDYVERKVNALTRHPAKGPIATVIERVHPDDAATLLASGAIVPASDDDQG